MKTLIFSDSHLHAFNENKFRFMESIIRDSDQVIINGDFWDGYLVSFDQFVHSPWRHLFPILKQKKTIYIFGNHDAEKLSSAQIKLFSEFQTQRYEMEVNEKKLIFEHGNRILPFFDELYDRFSKSNTALFHSSWLSDSVEKFIIQKFGNLALHRNLLRHHNRAIKSKLKNELKPNELYICGHTHCAEVDLQNQFINTGLIKYGLGQYMIIDNGKLTFKEEKYR